MDSAGVRQLVELLQAQETHLSCQKEFQTAMASNLGNLSAQLQGLQEHLAPPTPAAPLNQVTRPNPATPPPTAIAVPVPTASIVETGSKLAPPAKFSGELGQCKTFLIDCSIHFELTPNAFSTNRSKMAFMISHMTGRVKAWASVEWSRNTRVCNSISGFEAALIKTFEPVTTSWEKAQELSGLRQGTDSACDYGIRFHTLATESNWNSTALYDVFWKGLAAPIQDLLISLDLPEDLDSLIALAIRTDNRINMLRQQLSRGRTATAGPPPGWTTHSGSSLEQRHHSQLMKEEPMQLRRTQLSQERHKRQVEGRCFYCGESGHLVAVCPAKKSVVASQLRASETGSRILTNVRVCHHTVTELQALIDSGADANMMNWSLADKLGLKSKLLEKPITAKALNGEELFSSHMSQNPFSCALRTTESTSVFIYSSHHPIL